MTSFSKWLVLSTELTELTAVHKSVAHVTSWCGVFEQTVFCGSRYIIWTPCQRLNCFSLHITSCTSCPHTWFGNTTAQKHYIHHGDLVCSINHILIKRFHIIITLCTQSLNLLSILWWQFNLWPMSRVDKELLGKDTFDTLATWCDQKHILANPYTDICIWVKIYFKKW